MNLHENARTTPRSRMLMIERLRTGWSLSAVAEAQGVSIRTVRKWRGWRSSVLAALDLEFRIAARSKGDPSEVEELF